MRKHNFKNLKIWLKAMDLTDLSYNYCKDLPADERFNLIDQLIEVRAQYRLTSLKDLGKE